MIASIFNPVSRLSARLCPAQVASLLRSVGLILVFVLTSLFAIGLPDRASATISCGNLSAEQLYVSVSATGITLCRTSSYYETFVSLAGSEAVGGSNSLYAFGYLIYYKNGFQQETVSLSYTSPSIQCLSTSPYGGTGVAPCLNDYECRAGYPCDWRVNLATDGVVATFSTINQYTFNVTVSGGPFDAPAAQPLALSLAHDPVEVAPGETTRLTYTLHNPNTDARLTATQAGFDHETAYFAPGFVTVEQSPAPGFCGAGSSVATSGASFLQFRNISLPPGGSCSFSVIYRVDTNAPTGPLRQQTSEVSQSYPEQSSAVYTARVEDTLQVTADADTTPPVLSAPDVTIVFRDNVRLSGLLQATASDDRGVREVRFLLNGTEIPADYSFGGVSGTHIVVVEAEDYAGNIATTNIAVTIYDVRSPTFTASVTPDTVPQGGNATLEFEISLPAGASPMETIQFDQELQYRHSGIYIEAAELPANPCGAGSTLALSGTSFISLRGGILTEGQTCRFSVPFHVLPTATITAANMQTSPLGATQPDTGVTTSSPAAIVPFTIVPGTGTFPVLTPPSDITVATDPGSATATVSFSASASDAEDGDLTGAVVLSPASGSAFPIGQTTVTAAVTDSDGNTTTGRFTVTVNDEEAPVLTPPATVSLNTDAGQATGTFDVTGLGSASDNSGLAPTLGYAIGGTPLSGVHDFPIGETIVDMTAQDAAGNMATASFAVIVADTEAPIIDTADISVPLDAGLATATVDMGASVSDNSGASLTPSYSLTGGVPISNPHSFGEGMHLVSVSVTDPSGNNADAQFQVTVYPDQPLTLSSRVLGGPLRPATPVSYELTLTNPNGVAIQDALFFAALGTEAGGPVAPLGMTLSYTGVTGGCAGTIVAAPPGGGLGIGGIGISVPANTSCTITGQVTVTDSTPLGTVPVFGHTGFDNIGGDFPNAISALTPIVVAPPPDLLAPVLTLPADVTTDTDAGLATATVSFAVSALDDVDGDLSSAVTLSHTPGSAFPIGVTEVTASVSDTAGNNTQGSFTVTVTDAEPPVLTPPAAIVTTHDPGTAVARLDVTSLGSVSDNSGVLPAITYAINGTGLTGAYDFPLGITTVTMDATDTAGNAAQQVSFTVTVEDNTAPTIALSADQTRLGAGETARIDFALSEAAFDFDLSDVQVTGGTLDGFNGTGTAYQATFTPDSGTGTAVISVADNAFTDAAGNANSDGADADNRIDILFDSEAPSATISALAGPVAGVFTATITLSEPSDDFTADDLDLTNATASLTGGGASYALQLTPLAEGTVSVTVRAGSFSDAFGNSNLAASNTSDALFDVTAPDVEILGLPDNFTAGARFSVTIRFSEPVSGFDATDIALTNAGASGFAGAGAVYTLDIQPTGAGNVTMQIPAGVATDAAGNGNHASAIATVQNTTVAETQTQISQFMASRANLLVSNQPGLSCHLRGGCNGAGFDAHATRDALSFNLTSRTNGPVWFTLSANRNRDGSSESEYLFGAFGSHYQVSDTLLVGLMYQIDHVSSRDGLSEIEGTGWMAGPYVVGKLPEQPVYYEARLLAGETDNRISPFGTYSDDFRSQRWLAQFALSGALEYGTLTLIPSLSGTYTSDRQRAYTDSLGNPIPEQTVDLFQSELGLGFETPALIMDHPWTIEGGLAAIFSGTSTSGAASANPPSYEGGRARLDLAARTTLRNGAQLNLGASYDGIGARGYETIGLEIGYQWDF